MANGGTGARPNTFNVNMGFLSDREGGQQLVGYVPNQNGVVQGQSGVTFGRGVDLGQMTADQFNALPISDPLKDQLRPFVGVQG